MTTPLHLGPLRLEPPFLLGGLAGYADRFFRLRCRRLGASAVFTPMLLDRALLAAGRLARLLPPPLPGERPVIGQLVGAEPDDMARAAAILVERGFDGVDVNLACPAPKVLRRGRGGRLLQDPARALAVLAAVREAVAGPVSAKLRAGFDEGSDHRERFFRIAEGALDLGLDALVVHPRTVLARYSGRSDPAVLAALRSRFPRASLIGSGDLFEAEAGLRMLETTGVNGVAFARGAIGNPWIFARAAALAAGADAPHPTPAERAAFLRDYAADLVAALGEGRALRRIRKTAIKMARYALHAKRLRVAFAEARTFEAFEAALGELERG
jgi:nifR3 family TIM-barrel protein